MSNPWLVLFGVGCGTFMATLDSSIVNIALPTLTRDLSTNLGNVKWVVVLYLLVLTISILPLGRLSDLYGRKRVFVGGFALFIFGSALCGFSETLSFLNFSRVVQALGAAMLMANGPAIITSTFPKKKLGKALGVLAMVVSVGLIAGPSLGGLLISIAGWRSIFLVNIPVGLLGIGLISHYFTNRIKPPKNRRFDWSGMTFQAIFLLSFVTLLDPDAIAGPQASAPIVRGFLAVIAMLSLLAFIQAEKKNKAALLDMSLLKIRSYWSGNLSNFLMFVSFSSVSVLMPFFLENSLFLDTRRSGLFMTLIPLTILVVAPIAGQLSDHLGSRGLSATGSLVLAGTLFMLSGIEGPGLSAETPTTLLALAMVGFGISLGLFQSPNNNAIMGNVPGAKLSSASAFLATVRNLGLVSGAALCTTVFAIAQQRGHDLPSAIRASLFVSGIFASLAVLSSFVKEGQPHWKKTSPRAPKGSSPGARSRAPRRPRMSGADG